METIGTKLPVGRNWEEYDISQYFLGWLCTITDYELKKMGHTEMPGASYFFTGSWLPGHSMEVLVERSIELPQAYLVQKTKFSVKRDGSDIWMMSYQDGSRYKDGSDKDLRPDIEKLERISIERASQDN